MGTPPREPLGTFPTPLHRHAGLADLLGLECLWLKRDDLSGFAWGGNKVRTVEYLLGDALEQRATTVVMGSGPSSNFAATMTAAARGAGLEVEQFCYGSEPDRWPVALRVTRELGGNVRFTGSDDRSSMERGAQERGAAIAAAGGRPYVVPRGGATPVGSLGFAKAAAEVAAQMGDRSIEPDHVVITVGSGGSMAGLLAGWAELGVSRPLTGVSVSRPVDDISAAVASHARACADLLGTSPERLPSFHIVDGRGRGFGIAERAEVELASAVEQRCGLLLDPTYMAKTVRWMADNRLTGTVLLWHTGGALGVVDRLTRSSHSFDLKNGPTS